MRAFNALLLHFDEQKKISEEKSEKRPYNEDDKTQRHFAKCLCEQIFWPLASALEYDDKSQTPPYVDQACVQFAIDTFGPWRSLFKTIWENLEDPEQSVKPILYFHGRTPKTDLVKKITSPGDFLLRYNDATGAKSGGLRLLWGKKGQSDGKKGFEVIPREEDLKRRKLSKTKKVVWTWYERIAQVGGTLVIKNDYASVGKFLEAMKGKDPNRPRKEMSKLNSPVMLVSAYRCFGGVNNSKKAKLDSEVQSIMLGQQ